MDLVARKPAVIVFHDGRFAISDKWGFPTQTVTPIRGDMLDVRHSAKGWQDALRKHNLEVKGKGDKRGIS